VLAAAVLASAVLTSEATAAAAQPNIVLVLTDDQRWDTLWAMPTVNEQLVARGVTFTNAFASNPLCCPSRATILTGRYSQLTRVYTNTNFGKFDDSSTIATWLRGAGYRTALVGKYLNRYEGPYIPPGWNEWIAFSRIANYFGYTLNVNGVPETFGALESEYSTDVLAARAASVVETTHPNTPLFLVYAPFAPHGRRGDRLAATPAPRHAGSFAPPVIAPWRPPSFGEADLSDKPRWIRRIAPLTPQRIAKGDFFRQTQLESLQAVDEAVGMLLEALETSGRLDNTMFVFMSDNGHTWGEHRWFNKGVFYEESLRVPMVVRYDPLTGDARGDAHLVANADLAPTFAELAGIPAPGVQGRSLLPLLQRSGGGWRGHILLESLFDPIPAACGFRTSRYTYAQYAPGHEELYDLAVDPYQLDNLSARPLARRAIVDFRAQVRTECRPRPPGFTPRSKCLILGTKRSEILRGTRRYDYICASDGADVVRAGADGDDVFGGQGRDVLSGQNGDDVLTGGPGVDQLLGGPGKDELRGVDGSRDLLDCGGGSDIVRADQNDRLRGCETVERVS
jgi:N-acetylglucosamine-6-sulfatase